AGNPRRRGANLWYRCCWGTSGPTMNDRRDPTTDSNAAWRRSLAAAAMVAAIEVAGCGFTLPARSTNPDGGAGGGGAGGMTDGAGGGGPAGSGGSGPGGTGATVGRG